MTNDEKTLVQGIIAMLQMLISGSGSANGNGHGAEVAEDRDLDGQYGDPVVKFNPRDWRGDSCKGLRMSECPPEFLDLLAGTFDYFAKQADEKQEVTASGKPVAPYKRKDAARARGWAKRLRAGWKRAGFDAPQSSNSFDGGNFETSGFEEVADTEIPF